MRLFERALRRTGLPLAFSAGYNPRPQISFPVALPLGYESLCEICEVELVRWISPRRARENLERELPEGIGLKKAQSVGHGRKAEVTGSQFRVLMDPVPQDLGDRLDSFMNKDRALVERKRKSGSKTLNVRDFVRSARLDNRALVLDVGISQKGTARPPEILSAVLDKPIEKLPHLCITRSRIELAAPPQQ